MRKAAEAENHVVVTERRLPQDSQSPAARSSVSTCRSSAEPPSQGLASRLLAVCISFLLFQFLTGSFEMGCRWYQQFLVWKMMAHIILILQLIIFVDWIFPVWSCKPLNCLKNSSFNWSYFLSLSALIFFETVSTQVIFCCFVNRYLIVLIFFFGAIWLL